MDIQRLKRFLFKNIQKKQSQYMEIDIYKFRFCCEIGTKIEIESGKEKQYGNMGFIRF